MNKFIIIHPLCSMQYAYMVKAGLPRDIVKIIKKLASSQRKIQEGKNCFVCNMELGEEFSDFCHGIYCLKEICDSCRMRFLRECKFNNDQYWICGGLICFDCQSHSKTCFYENQYHLDIPSV